MKLKKKILMIIAHKNFRDEEYSKPHELFSQKKFDVTVAANDIETQARGMLGLTVNADITVEQASMRIADYDAVVFVGGEGAKVYWDNKTAHKICQVAVKEKKVLAAICLAPVILANAGVLTHKHATVFPSEQVRIIMKHGIYTGKPLEQADSIITASTPAVAEMFAKKILAELEKMEAAPEQEDAYYRM